MKNLVGISVILLCLLPAAFCQDAARRSNAGTEQPGPPLTYEQLAKSAKIYFRDTTEFPMTQKMTYSVTDNSGHVRKVTHLVLDYVFNGYRPGTKTASGNARANISFWAVMRGAKMLKASMNSTLWTMIAGGTPYGEASVYKFEAQAEGGGDRLITARLNRSKPCTQLTMQKNPQVYFPDDACGALEYQLHNTLSFQKFVFDADGLPALVTIEPFGKSTLRRYHVEIEFQKVLLAGDNQPFLAPRQVTAKLETNKGSLEITSVYEAKDASSHPVSN